MTESESDQDRDLVVKDAAYFDEVRKALGRGAPTVLLGTSNRKLDHIVARLAAAEASGDQARNTDPGIATGVTAGHDYSSHVRDRLRRRPGPLKARDSQGTLFKVPEFAGPLASGGYGTWITTSAAGITGRQLRQWVRTGLVGPSAGTASTRLFVFHDIFELALVKRLHDTGTELKEIKAVLAHLRDRTTRDLAGVTLMSDGATIYEATSADEIVDLLQGGQGIFGIALSTVLQDMQAALEAALTDLPSDEDQASGHPPSQIDNPKATRDRRTG